MGSGVAYGGDLRRSGFTDVLFDLVRAYADEGRMLREELVHWFVGWPLTLKLDDEIKASLSDVIALHPTPKPSDVDLDEDEFVAPADAPYAWLRCMTEMRREMVETTHARVLVGGQLLASTPRSGIAEEFALSIAANQPVYLCGGFGGMTAEIIAAVRGAQPEALTEEFHTATEQRRAALEHYNASEVGGSYPIDYEGWQHEFASAGVAGLRNGLSEEENLRLFSSQSIEVGLSDSRKFNQLRNLEAIDVFFQTRTKITLSRIID